MILLVLLLIGAIGMVLILAFLLGFRLGGQSWMSQVQRVRAEAAVAERQIHDLTRSAFVAMAEEAEAHRTGRPTSRS